MHTPLPDAPPAPWFPSVAALADDFAHRRIPQDRWTHREHLAVALALVHRHGLDEGMTHLRSGILALNRVHGVEETPTRGYHETITRFWAWFTTRFLESAPGGASLDELEPLLWAAGGDRELPLRHWSRERLFSKEARAGWVEPDVRALE